MSQIEIECVHKEVSEPNHFNSWNIWSSTIESCDLPYNSFFNNFMFKNLPCIVKNVSKDWECTKQWVCGDTINYEYFLEKYGDKVAPVADCNSITFNSQCKSDMKVSAYINYLKSDRHNKLLYLKDWHLRRCTPDETFYEVPQIFASDWLNEYAQDKQEDDFMFVYIGPKNSWTPLHADVYCSYSWSVNVVGKKKWIMFPPGEEEKLKDKLGNLPLMFDPTKYDNNLTYFEISQEIGDAIFVPSGWYHQVVNEIDTISINHNWINACNIETIWKALLKSLKSVENVIEEFKDTPEFSSQCQLILKSDFGMDCGMFINFLCYIGQKRLSQLQGGIHLALGSNHLKFDLKNILKVMDLITIHPSFLNKASKIEYDMLTIKKTISEVLNLNYVDP